VEIGDIVVGNHVSWAVQPDRRIRSERRREFLSVHSIELRPKRPVPSEQVLRIIPAIEVAVSDVEIAGPGVVRKDPEADVLKAALLDRQSFRAGDKLCSGPNRDIRIADGYAFEIVVVGCLDVEQVVVAVAIKDDLTISPAPLMTIGLSGVPFAVR